MPDDRPALHLGLDVGTSGVRAVAIDDAAQLVASARVAMAAPRREGARVRQDPALWWTAVEAALDGLLPQLDRGAVASIAVDGTSGTLLLTDARGMPLGEASMYDDASAVEEARRVAAVAAPDSAAIGPASPLARLLQAGRTPPAGAAHVQHQAEWIAGRLAGRPGLGDEHNALKLGYDPQAGAWPGWIDTLGVPRGLLPQVLEPGSPLGPIAPALAVRFGLPATTVIAAGTTDGVAAFLASGADRPGDAVTSLGSTLVLKLLVPQPLRAPALGVYSHRLGTHWLAGGASNSGGAALRRHFSVEQMAALTPRLQPDRPTGLDYRPLAGTGERFPVADSTLASRTLPRPGDDAIFFQGLLEGIAAVEAQGYRVLASLGAPAPVRVFSSGGGAANAAWCRIRERMLGVPVLPAAHDEPAVGAARLARRAVRGR